MAEGVVGILILKLGSALVLEACRLGTKQLYHEAWALGRLFGEIRDIKEELESMQSFLQGAERFKDTNNTLPTLSRRSVALLSTLRMLSMSLSTRWRTSMVVLLQR